jgi:uncharacterized protein YdaU (DUF1376 family)
MHKYWRHLGDYSRKTRHLSMLEHGAYTLLLDVCYDREKPLPADLKEVFRLVGARAAHEKKAVCTVIKEFFTLTSEGHVNKRVLEELAEYQGKSDGARKAAGIRWHSERNADASTAHDKRNASRARSSNQQPATNNQSTLPGAADAASAGGSGELELLDDEPSATKDTSAEAEGSGAKKEKGAAAAQQLTVAEGGGAALTVVDGGLPEFPETEPPGWLREGKVRRVRPRGRNELFDAVARVCGMVPEQVTKSAGGEIGKALSEIKGVCEGVSVAEIERRARAYRREWPLATLSPSALAKHWGRFGGGAKKEGGPGLGNEVMVSAPEGWELAMPELFGEDWREFYGAFETMSAADQRQVRAWLGRNG